MNPRSIRFRLIMWYAGLLTGVFLLFGIALYQVLRGYLEHSLAQTLIRRSEQIAVSLLEGIEKTGEHYVADQITNSLCAGKLRSVYPHNPPGRQRALRLGPDREF